MKSKILAAISDPADPNGSIFIAESAGFCRRVNLEVSFVTMLKKTTMLRFSSLLEQKQYTEDPRHL